MPISHDIVNLKGKSTLSSCSEWNKFLKRVSGSTKECATEAQTLNHNLVNISFFKIDELGLVGKCVKHAFRIYMGCYLQFCITKKLRSVNKNLSKVHFFHILSAHAKGLKPYLYTRRMRSSRKACRFFQALWAIRRRPIPTTTKNTVTTPEKMMVA